MASNPNAPQAATALGHACRVCTIRLEQWCYARAWWFRAFREILASGIRLFALAYHIPADRHPPRSAMCHRCLRFRKNALKERSALFRTLDSFLNPLFNRVRDSLLSPAELAVARDLAEQAADPEFVMHSPCQPRQTAFLLSKAGSRHWRNHHESR